MNRLSAAPPPLKTGSNPVFEPLPSADSKASGTAAPAPLCLHHQAICGVGPARGRAWVEFLLRSVGAESPMALVHRRYASQGAGFDLAVLDRALELGEQLHHATRLGVNIHPASLHVPAFSRALLRRLHRHPRLGGRLVLELVEFQGAVDPERCRPALLQLRQAGVRIALDDFGPGSPNLDLIAEGWIDVLKLDRSLISELDRAPRKLDLLGGLVELARCTGMELVAEGVETVSQFERLRSIGVPWMQGYLFGRPGPVRSSSTTSLPEACSPRPNPCSTPNRTKEIHA